MDRCYRHKCKGVGVVRAHAEYGEAQACSVCGAMWAYAPAPAPKPKPVARLVSSRELTQEQQIMRTIVKQGRALKW